MRAVFVTSVIVAILVASPYSGRANQPFSDGDRSGRSGRRGPDWASDASERSRPWARRYYGGSRPSHKPYWGGAYRFPAPYPYSAYPGYYPPHPAWYSPYYLPPVHVPAEELYGPRAVQRFMGVDHWFQQPQSAVVIRSDGLRGAEPAPCPPHEPEDPKPGRGTNPQAVNRAWRFVGFGDAHFANENYVEANARYRKAAAAAPQLAEPYFRQGYALMAMGRYDLAVQAIRRGMEREADWPTSGFQNAELYGDNPQVEVAHLDALAAASEKDPHNADLLFLVGVMLHFHGSPERARPFFERAVQLLPGNDAHVKAFLAK